VDLVALQREQVADEVEDVGLVLNDQDAGHAYLQRADPRRLRSGSPR
jgi:hypothetical protein